MCNPGGKVAFIAPAVALADVMCNVFEVSGPVGRVAPVVERSVVFPVVGPPGVSLLFPPV